MRSPPIVIDANLLLLLVVGTTDKEYINKHKRLSHYIEEDFMRLSGIVEKSSQVIVSPNILTETSNLAAYIAEPAKTEIFCVFRELINRAQENYVASRASAACQEFARLGLTDCSVIEESKTGAVVVTVDLDLYTAVVSMGGEAVNFNHIRNEYL